jgi:uncharacterized protein (DUF433 family)
MADPGRPVGRRAARCPSRRGAESAIVCPRAVPSKQVVRARAEPWIPLDAAVLDGKPVVRGTRLSVEHLIGLMAEGGSETEILADHPGLTHEDLTACLAHARDLLRAERVMLRMDRPTDREEPAWVARIAARSP